MTDDCNLRRARRDDLDALVELCAEHAAYERSEFTREGKRAALAAYVFGEPPRVNAWVAASAGALLGYATWSREASTWRATDFASLDCLFLRPAARGRGLGEALVRAVMEECRAAGLEWLEWQTPAWNEGAIRFYERLGASHATKERFGIATDGGPSASGSSPDSAT